MRHITLAAQTRVALALANGNSDRNGVTMDLLNWSGIHVTIHVHSVDAGGACTYKLMESNASDMSGETLVPSCSLTITDTDDGEVFELDHVAPDKRYYRLVADKTGAPNIQESATYQLYEPKLQRTADVTNEVTSLRTIAATGQYTGP